MAKLFFLAAITLVFSVKWSFRNDSNMLFIIINIENNCAT